MYALPKIDFSNSRVIERKREKNINFSRHDVLAFSNWYLTQVSIVLLWFMCEMNFGSFSSSEHEFEGNVQRITALWVG